MGGILPAATTTLVATQPTSQAIFDAFIPFGYMEIGVLAGALIIVFIVYTFWDTILHLLGHSREKFENTNLAVPKYKPIYKSGKAVGYQRYE